MATYKKNNNRPNRNRQVENLDEEQEQQLHTESTTAEVFDALDLGASKSEDFVRNNQKTIIGVLIGIAVIGLGYLLYQQFVKAPNEQKAANEFFFAQQFFDEAMQATNAKERDSLFKVSIISKLPKTIAVPKLPTLLNTVWVWLICAWQTIITLLHT